jgi:pimeloyl-ACP methyl ester carboxylesterase
MIALMDQAGLSRAIFVGTSMGGLIAMTLSAMRPDLIGGVVLNDVGPEIGQEGLARISSYVGGAPRVDDWSQAADYARRINAQALPHLSDRDWEIFARRIFRQDAAGVLSLDYDPAISQAFKAAPASAPATPAPDLWPLFAALTIGRPTLLIRGALSDILDADIAARMALAAPHMTSVTVDGVGHAPLLEEPEAEAAIAAFLQTAP